MTTTTLPTLSLAPPAAPRQGLGEMASTLIGSEILKIAGEVRTLVAAGQRVCNLTVGDFAPREFRIPAPLEEGIARALAAGQTNYPPSDGVAELRRAVAGFYEAALGLAYPLEGILIAGGARPIIYSAYRAILDPGDTVVFPVPSWNNNHYAHLCGARAVAVPASAAHGFLPTAAELAPHLPGAALLVLNSPLNPAGSGFQREQLAEIAAAVVAENRRRGPGAKPLFLLYDQIYWMVAAESAPHHTPVALVPEVAPYTVFVDGISKAFAATGLRVGWTAAPPFLVARMRDLLGHIGAWAPRPEQVATAELLGSPELALRLAAVVRDAINVRLGALHDGLERLRLAGLPVAALPPAGALYLSARFDLVDRLGSNEAIRRHLLADAAFAAVPFQAFGLREDSGWFRLSVGAVSVDDIAQALPRLEQALARAAGVAAASR
jgi:aspartate aminotransferase